MRFLKELVVRFHKKIRAINAVEATAHTLRGEYQKEFELLHRLLDDFKSSFDVDPAWCDDFHKWRSQSSVPNNPIISVSDHWISVLSPMV